MGERTWTRGGLLRDTAARQNMIAAAKKEADNECGQCRLAIGQCSCNGGAQRQGTVMLAVQQPTTGVAGDRFPGVLIPGGAVNSGQGALVADAGGWVVVPPVGPGGYPKSLCDSFGVPTGWSRAMREVMMMGKQEPYVDSAYDWANMDTLYSDITTVGPGATVTIPTSPEIGTFAAFYYNVLAVDPTTQVQQVDWRVTRPSVTGCPVPCSNPGPILAQFVQRVPEACCGIPLTAFMDERSRNVPLNTPFTNNQAAGDLLVQIEVRGYCCSSRIC